MSFPWAIGTNSRTFRKRDKTRLAGWRARRNPLRLFVFLALGTITSSLETPSVRAAEPPPTALPNAATQFVTPGSGSALLPQTVGNAMTITQTSQKVILNWQSFNIGRDASVEFKQLDASSSALNRIAQGSASEIFGRLTANGQIYLLNQNGIIFGKTAQVNTHSLIASTLNISNKKFLDGLTNAINQGEAAFSATDSSDGIHNDWNMNPNAFIQVESGAVLKTGEGGSIMMFAPTILNNGEIDTPGGQTILAASKDLVYLAASDPDDPNLRGLLVEVKTGGNGDPNHPDVENLGKIVAERGNITLLGLAVNQDGIVRATTSVNLGGSIRLVAQDKAQVTVANGVGTAQATHAGTLILGPNSLTEVAPDDLSATAVDAQKQPVSQVEMVGHDVELRSGAHIVAPSGNVQILATNNPGTPGLASNNNDSVFKMESGSSIDVSGLRSAVLPMERNSVAVELRGNELRDSPLQRNGPLYGKTVYVDARKGTPLADVSGQIAAIQRPLAERLSAGGTVSIVSEGDVVTEKGSTIDVSGGAIRYLDGYVNTTQLISQGRVYDIGVADPNRIYDGIFGDYKVVNRKWGVTQDFKSSASAHFESGYVEGKDAGSVAINAHSLDLQGTLSGGVTTDRYQRLPQSGAGGFTRAYDQVPLGGKLALGAASFLPLGGGSAVSAGDASGIEDFTLQSLAELGADGMNRLSINANGKITVPDDANFVLAPGGALTLTGGQVDVQGDITAPGGNVQITASGTGVAGDAAAASLGENGRIDVSGQWINDSVALNPGAAPQGPVFINGGNVSITAKGNLFLEAGSVIDAGGGAQLQRAGQLKYGAGGTITVTDNPSVANANTGTPSVLRLDGELQAYSFDKGGSLNLTGAGFFVGANKNDAPTNTVYLSPDFFERGGFDAYNLTSTHTGITIAQNTDIELRPMNRVLGSQFNLQPTGTPLNQVSDLAFLPDYQQRSVSLGLTLTRAAFVPDTAHVEMESGSSIHANPGASVALSSDTNLIVDGTIDAPAGNISLSLNESVVNPPPVGTPASPQAIWLGPQGSLFAGAVYQPIPDTTGRGRRLGTVLNGGTVNIDATAGNTQRGYFIASPGSRIDVSGTTQTLDVTQGSTVTPTAVNGAAGSINLTATEGMALNGDLIGTAGSGTGAAGGTLSITLNEAIRNGVLAGGTIAVTTAPADAPQVGQQVPAALSGLVRVNPDKIRAGGFDSLMLATPSNQADAVSARIRLEGDVQLNLARSLVLDTSVLSSDGGHAELSAPYLALGTATAYLNSPPPAPSGGSGSLSVHGQHVDLIGTLVMQGFGGNGGGNADSAPVQIQSDGDIRFIGGNEIQNRADGIFIIGRLNSAADVTLRANQVYSATVTDYTVSVTGSGGKITIQPGGASEAPLSAGSKLTLKADNIEQDGTLRAPFGQIELDAKNDLVLGNGSVTSVSGNGQLVPFGQTQFGQDWLYPLTIGSNVTNGIYTASPEKRIQLNGGQVTLAPGSVVDVTGGGDLTASEQQPGPGGSFDILLDPAHVNGAFAIVPTHTDLYGSYDPFFSSVSSVKSGDTIHLAGGGPLPAGEYAMLPAGYALLPGAYLVTPLAKNAAPIPGQVVRQNDGSSIVAGQLGAAGTDARSNLWSAYMVENGAQIRTRAEYLESRADSFFAKGSGSLNRDAGQLVISAGTALTLGGTLASTSTGGRGSEVDILANNLAVVASYTGANDRVELLDSGLNELNADSLLLGATREHQGANVALHVQATNVSVESGTALSAPEVMLAATDHVSVAGGATITAKDGSRVQAPTSIQLSGDSAFARVSSTGQVRVNRVASTGAKGTLDVAAGAVLDASNLNASSSITLDASRDTVVDGNMLTHGGSLSLAASRVSLGDTQGVNNGGLVLSNDRLNQLDASELILGSRGSIDLYGQVALNNLKNVALDAAGLGGYNNAGQNVSISADTISLSNRSGAGFTGVPDGSDTLNITASKVVTLGGGDFAVRGFSNTTISATDQIIARPETDTPVQLHVAGDLTLETSRLTASKGADVSIDTRNVTGDVVGKMTLTTPATTTKLGSVTDLGAKLELTATEIDDGGHIELPSGIVNLHATTGSVNIASNASIDVAGRDLLFADLTVGSPGGNVSLTSDQGDVTIGAARIDVSGTTSGGDAGTLSISAPNGTVQVDPKANLAATHATGARAGSFALDAQKLVYPQSLTDDFSAFNAALNADGFTDSRLFRLRSGDVAIAAGYTVQAHDLQITADAGRIDVYGKVDASGEQAGQVALYARDDVSLHGASTIDAHATGLNERGISTGLDEKGGNVTLASTAGRLDLQAGAEINVAGTDASGAPTDTGTVHLRAARVGTSDVAINPIAATIDGAEHVDIEAYKTYAAANGVIDNLLIGNIQIDTNAFMNNADTIKATLAAGSNSPALFHLLPGVEIDSSSDLALNANWNLLTWRYGGEAGVLTLKAAGDLNINQNLSDGVASVTNDTLGTVRDTALPIGAQSWSYNLIAGADLTSANSLAVLPRADLTDAVGHVHGNVTLASDKLVRTGTGNIEIAASGDLRLANSGAAINTAGENRGTGGMPDAPSLSLSAADVQELLLNGDFLQNGGNIGITVGGDIQGANGHQLVNDWLARTGGGINLLGEDLSLPASWAVNLGAFRQNIGALGGGNVSVTAGGNIENLSVAIPTTGQPVSGSNAPSIAGGGDLTIKAGGDIGGGVFYLGKGQADLQAGGSITRAPGETVYPVLALGDGQYKLRARKNLTIEGVVNPTVLPISTTQGAIDPSSGQPYVTPTPSYFFTYTPDSAVRLESISGDVTWHGDVGAVKAISNNLASAVDATAFTYLPGSLSARSLQEDIVIGGIEFTLLPAPHGNLELLADGSIKPAANVSPTLLLSDADPALLPGVLAPAAGLENAKLRLATQGSLIHAATPVHQKSDTDPAITAPAYIVAENGDIGSTPGSQNQLTLMLSKQTRIYAGGDINNLNLRVQQTNPGDISVVEAGGSVLFPTVRNVSGGVLPNLSQFEVDGPGQFYVIAGKDVDLGASNGIVSVGRTRNPALPAGGADIMVMAGQSPTPDYSAFITKYLVNEDTYHDQLAQYMKGLGSSDTTVAAFQALPLVQQRQFILEVFFSELRASGVDAATSKNYQRGFDAIATLFSKTGYDGDIKSFLSQITTTDGGNINLVVPGGLVNAGVAGSTTVNKKADQIGIVAARAGNIDAFVRDDFLVNSSRVFALDGGDILIWSSIGNIDAGKGAKTALSIPPPITTFDANGNAVVQFPAAISGSGIRGAVSTPGRKPGDVFLIAPVGVINAGDAGIGTAGNLTIAATAVLGADNIQVGGASVGVPTDTGGLGAGLAGVGDIAATASKLAEDATRGLGAQANERQGFLGVEVLGFGE